MELKMYFAAYPGSRKRMLTELDISQSYMSQLVHGHTSISVFRATQIERLTDGKVKCEELRPDIDWSFLRNDRG